MALVLTHATMATVDADDSVQTDSDIRIEGSSIAAIGPGGNTGVAGGYDRRLFQRPGAAGLRQHPCVMPPWRLFRGLADDRSRAFWPEGGYRVPGQDRFTADDYHRSLTSACSGIPAQWC